MSTFKGDEKRLFPAKGKNPLQAEIFKRNFKPRPDLIIDEIQQIGDMDGEERQAIIEREMKRTMLLRRN